MGADPAVDLRPHVLAGLAASAFHSAFEVLNAGVVKSKRMSDVLDQVFAVLEDGLTDGPAEKS
jgi:hypothetical protein